MKHLKTFENDKFPGDKEYFEIVGYKASMLVSLSHMYQLWCDAEDIPQLSADEQDTDNMTSEQKEFNANFIRMWEIAADFEREYHQDEWKEQWLMDKETKKYNI